MPSSSEETSMNGACNFATLSTYNAMGNPAMVAYPTPDVPVTTALGYQIVPAYSNIGYGTLVKGGNSCSGFATITSAYGTNANNCQTQYVKRMCA